MFGKIEVLFASFSTYSYNTPMFDEQESRSMLDMSPTLRLIVSSIKCEDVSNLGPLTDETMGKIIEKIGVSGLTALVHLYLTGEPTVGKVFSDIPEEESIGFVVFLMLAGFEIGERKLVQQTRDLIQSLYAEDETTSREDEAKAYDMLLRIGVHIKGMPPKGGLTDLDLMDIYITATDDPEKTDRYLEWRKKSSPSESSSYNPR